MKVYESNFMYVEFFKDSQLIEITWLPSTETMGVEEYKKEFTNFLTIILDVKPQKVISDNQNLYLTMSIELQEWMNQTIFPSFLEVGLNKVAMLNSFEMVSQISVEQVMEEEEGMKFTTKYFDNKEKAKEWILSLPLD